MYYTSVFLTMQQVFGVFFVFFHNFLVETNRMPGFISSPCVFFCFGSRFLVS